MEALHITQFARVEWAYVVKEPPCKHPHESIDNKENLSTGRGWRRELSGSQPVYDATDDYKRGHHHDRRPPLLPPIIYIVDRCE